MQRPQEGCGILATLENFHECRTHDHAVNVALHALASVLLFFALLRLTARIWESAFVAALFALHPLHAESVAWAASRKDVLAGLFAFEHAFVQAGQSVPLA